MAAERRIRHRRIQHQHRDNRYFVQFDANGAIVREEALPSDGPSYKSITSDPSGGLWALGGVDSGAGSVASLIRLTSDGDFVWSRPLGPNGGSFAVNGTGEVVFSSAESFDPPVYETVAAYSTDGSLTSSQVTPVDYLGEDVAERVVLDANGNTIVGGTFGGTVTLYADGSFLQTPAPVGVGFQRFDATGVLRSVTVWGGANAELDALGVAQNGNVILLGMTAQPLITSPLPNLFFVRFVP